MSLKQLSIVCGITAALAAATASCQHILVPEQDGTSADEIVFAASGSAFDAQVDTKASEVTSLTSFKAAAITGAPGSETAAWNNATFTGDGNYTGHKSWPASNPSYSFYATNRSGAAPMTFSDGQMTISATNAQDILCAYLPAASVAYKARNTLHFEHIFARLCNVVVQAESGYTISSVNIVITPRTGGTYNLTEGAGASDDTGWSSLVTGDPVTVASSTGTNTNDIYLVPGTYTVSASWTASQPGGSSISYSGKTVDVVITRSKRNTITATLGGEFVFGVTIEDFVDNEVPIYFGLTQSASRGTFSYTGGSEDVTLRGYAGTWDVSYSTDGGASYSAAAPSGLSVSRLSGSGGEQVYRISLGPATPTPFAEGASTAWPSDARHNDPLGTPASPVDLSMVDIHGDPVSYGRTTANTYVVHAPGTYMIPLIYGNAVTGGAVNTDSYICQNSGANIAEHFKNAYDTEISSPYIEADAAANGRSVASASLSWSDTDGLISVNSALQTHDGIKYLVFNVPSASINYGITVVSVRDDLGDVLWSWLVWVTGRELFDERIEARISPATDGVAFLSEDIGSKPSRGSGNAYPAFNCIVKFTTNDSQQLLYVVQRYENRVITSYTNTPQPPYYQFGRPTPNPSNDGVAAGTYTVSDGAMVSCGTMLRHPEKFFIRSTDPRFWCSDDYGAFHNVWNNNMTNSGADNGAIIKTVYDPSPAGYAVPLSTAFRYFTTDGNDHTSAFTYFNVIDWDKDGSITSSDYNYGWYMKRSSSDTGGTHFPAPGYRNGNNGYVSGVGTKGIFWASRATAISYALSFDFTSIRILVYGINERSCGFTVRPQKLE